jgi:hypothetical protein
VVVVGALAGGVEALVHFVGAVAQIALDVDANVVLVTSRHARSSD